MEASGCPIRTRRNGAWLRVISRRPDIDERLSQISRVQSMPIFSASSEQQPPSMQTVLGGQPIIFAQFDAIARNRPVAHELPCFTAVCGGVVGKRSTKSRPSVANSRDWSASKALPGTLGPEPRFGSRQIRQLPASKQR